MMILNNKTITMELQKYSTSIGEVDKDILDRERKRIKYEHDISAYAYRTHILKMAIFNQEHTIKNIESRRDSRWRIYNSMVNKLIQFGVDHQDSKIVNSARKTLWRRMPRMHKYFENIRRNNVG